MAELELWLDFHPDDAAALRGLPELGRLKGARTRNAVVSTVWHDSPDGALARDGLAMEEWRVGPETSWRVTRMRVAADAMWIPGTPGEVLAQGSDMATLGDNWPTPLLPVVAFDGTRGTVRLASGDGAVSMTLQHGMLRAVAAERVVCALMLRGPPELVLGAALAAARATRASIAARSFAASAVLLARPTSPSRPEPPLLVDGMTVEQAFAHMAAHLGATLLMLAPAAAARDGTEPVHQMRVAMRRLRSASALFRSTPGCPDLGEALEGLRGLARVLGPARDWDVFTGETAARLDAFAESKPVRRLLAAARRRRGACYADLRAYLESTEFRVLGIRLAGLAATGPWEAGDGEPVTLEAFAAHRLSRLRRKLLADGEDVTHLPLEALHALRIRAKRLRYAAEFFAPLFPGKAMARLIRRVSTVQEVLGVLNDGAVTDRLVAELGRVPGYAAGVVAGDVAARAGDTRARVAVAWRKLHRTPTAWN